VTFRGVFIVSQPIPNSHAAITVPASAAANTTAATPSATRASTRPSSETFNCGISDARKLFLKPPLSMHQRAQRKKRRLRRKCRRKAPPAPRSMHQRAQRKKRRSRRKRQRTVPPAHLLVSIHQRAPHLLRLPPSVCRSILPILPTPALNKVIRAMLTMPEKCLLTPIQRNLYIAQELKHVGL